MSNSPYHPEPYWSAVAARIKSREGGKNVIAGDDEPFYRYKRERFLALLHSVAFRDKSVLEIGHGPGGNLLEIYPKQPSKLMGVDISADMVALAKAKLPEGVSVQKIDGTKLPFEDQSIDIIFTATVLQHNTDEAMMGKILGEIARVSKDCIYLFERVESEIKGDDLCKGRPVSHYAAILEPHGFHLVSTLPINIRVSYYVCGVIRKVFNAKSRQEGEPMTGIATFLQNSTLPITKLLDKVFTSGKDVVKMEFKRK